jgi:hypothetical protein
MYRYGLLIFIRIKGSRFVFMEAKSWEVIIHGEVDINKRI